MNNSYEVISPLTGELPIVISCPHVGTEIPPDIKKTMFPDIAERTEDTDWFIHELYGFAASAGITMIKANYSRYVVDLNRDPDGRSLYADQRRQTALVPLTTFSGQDIYQSGELLQSEIERRRILYFDPYHAEIGKLIKGLRNNYQHVLFFDAHSIKRLVPSIRSNPFPDMIVGDNQGKTAHQLLANTALSALKTVANFSVSHNDPFMGGYLTRSIGKPGTGVHALQLEMAQDLYMNEDNNSRNAGKQAVIAAALQHMFNQLTEVLKELNT